MDKTVIEIKWKWKWSAFVQLEHLNHLLQ